jgi:hypothetical protein
MSEYTAEVTDWVTLGDVVDDRMYCGSLHSDGLTFPF